jgi:hypothetical protein
VFLLLSIQSIRPTYFGRTIDDWFQNYTEKAKILYFLNLVYFLSLGGLWQNHVLYWTLTDFMWRHMKPFGKGRVNKFEYMFAIRKIKCLYIYLKMVCLKYLEPLYPCGLCVMVVGNYYTIRLWIHVSSSDNKSVSHWEKGG